MTERRTLQWEANPWESLEVPEELQRRVRYRVVAYVGQGRPLVAYVEDYHGEGPWLILFGALLDTSERFEGQVTRKRITWRERVSLYNASAVIIPLDEEDGQ
mgnify:CR=1 FL=1|jgi:hypothetical protein